MPLLALKHVGLEPLALRVTSILEKSGQRATKDPNLRQPDEESIEGILALADQELFKLDVQLKTGDVSNDVFTRRRYTILCILKMFADEFQMSPEARARLDEYLSHGSRSIPETLDTRLPNNCTVKCRMTDYVEFMTWVFGVYEPLESYIFSFLIHEGMVVIDGGANIGQYSLLAATSVGSTGSVHSFEPEADNFNTLKINVSNNHLDKQCHLNNCALWGRDGSLVLIDPLVSQLRSYRTNNGAYQVAEETNGLNSSPRRVNSVTLDTYARKSSLRNVDLIKLDVEGAEPNVLDGAMDVLSEWRPLVLMEVNDHVLSERGGTSDNVFARMTSLGYACCFIGGRPETAKHYNCLFYAGAKPEALSHAGHAVAREWAIRGVFNSGR